MMKRNLMNELTEGIDSLAERRKMERERLDERLGKRERVNQEELFAPHMEEERCMTRDQLLKDYARIIDEQRKEIEALKESVEYYADMMYHYME